MRTKQKPNGYWNNLENRIDEVNLLLEKTGKSPKELTTEDFRANGLSRLLSIKSSLYDLLKEVGLADFEPWEMKCCVPRGYWKESVENRARATKWLVEKTGKDPKDIREKDFKTNNLGGLLQMHINSPYFALKEAGLAEFEPWESSMRAPTGFWEDIKNRINAIKWLVEKTKKDSKEITPNDFKKNNLGGLLHIYNGSSYFALKEAGLVDFEPWEMKNGVPQGYWKESVENSARATKWLVEKTGKAPKNITANDFEKNGLCGLLSNQYDTSPYLALKEAGLVDFEPWEMKSGAPQGYWKESVENRTRAIKWLVEKTGKDSKEITVRDFKKNNLSGLLINFYNGSSYLALKDAGYNINPWEMKCGVPNGYWEESAENKVKAVKWLVDKTGKDPKDITRNDFRENGLSGLLWNQYDSSPCLALKEAGYDIKVKRNNPSNAAELLKKYIQN